MRQLAGRRVFVRTAITPGRPPLLLIHGYPTASYDWVRVWPRLAARHSLYALDLLGFGRSEKPRDTDYPIELQADLCMALLDDFGVGNAHVLAHDYGDTVAQELLAREREGQLRIASMAFLNGGLFPETHRARPIQKLLANPLLGPLLARAMDYGKFEQTMLSIAGREPPSREELQDLWVLIEHDGGRAALARLINYMAQRRRNRPRWVGALVESKRAARTDLRRRGPGVRPASRRALSRAGAGPRRGGARRRRSLPATGGARPRGGRVRSVPRPGRRPRQPSTNTLTRMSPMPISAAPAIRPAQIGSSESTHSR